MFSDQNQWLFEFNFLSLLVIDKVWRNVSSVELESFDEFNFVLKCLALTDCDDACVSDLFEEISEFLADLLITIG